MSFTTGRTETSDRPSHPTGRVVHPNRRRHFRPSVLLVLAIVALVALAAAVAYVGRVSHDTHSALLFGDSITDISTPAFHQDLDGEFAVTVSGVSGARVDQRLPDAPRFAALHTGQIIINLGTNDLLQQRPIADTEHDLMQLATSFPDARCVHLVTMNIDMFNSAQPDLAQRAQELNNWIVATAADRGWDVIRWDLEVHQYDLAGQPFGPITSDTVHPSEAGQHRLAELYRQALQRC